MLRGKSPRSPVWLRKIPSTVSGSQGSRRGLRPAVRFAFPLGARLNITLRARPCQELFSESFCRPSRGPRGASPLGGLALRGDEFGIIRSPAAARAGNPPAHRMPTTPARQSGGGRGVPGGREPPSWRFAPIRSPGASPRSIHGTAPEARGLASPRPIDIIAPGAQRFGSVRMRSRPGGPALARLGPPGRSIQLCVSFYLYISRRIGLTFRPGALPPSICKRRFPYRWRFLIRLRQTSHEANTSRGCFRQPRARRRVPSCNRP